MTTYRILFCLLFLVTFQYCFAQQKTLNNNKRVKATGNKIKKEAVTYSEEELNVFEEEWRRDSIKMEEEWTQQRKKDSILLEKENKELKIKIARVYRDKWYPKDSLSFIDDRAEKIFKELHDSSLQSLITAVNSQFKTPLHRARAIFYWIATNINYDWDGLKSNSVKYNYSVEKDAIQAFQTKKGVCEHFSSLYQYMAGLCGVESVKLTGYSKTLPYTKVSTTETDHAWNAVKINNRWRLLDVTWASKRDSTLESYWFDTPPEQFIYSHLPVDSEFQLINKKLIIKDFASMPIVGNMLFLSKAAINIPVLGYYVNNTGLFQLVMKNNNRKYRIQISITPYNIHNEKRFSGTEEWRNLPVLIKKNKVNSNTIYQSHLTQKGYWWIKVDIFEKLSDKDIGEIKFPSCMVFQANFL